MRPTSQTVQWSEDVRLLDGRVVTVNQKKLCNGRDYTAKHDASCLVRDAWVGLNLPEFSNNKIIWHENLNPMIINIFQGRLYIVGTPPTSLEFRKYGAVNPPYYGFAWKSERWERIPFADIPVEIYDGNMLIESIPKTRTDHVTLEQKKLKQGVVTAVHSDVLIQLVRVRHTELSGSKFQLLMCQAVRFS